MQSPIKLYLTLGLTLFAISSANGNYGYGQYNAPYNCDRGKFDQAQNNIRNDIVRSNPLQPQPPYSSSYSGMSNGYQANNQYANQQNQDNQCRLTRQSFNDLVTYTPLCETITTSAFHTSANLIDQGRQYLRNNCEQRNQGYQFLSCFKNYDLSRCSSDFTTAQSRVQSPTQVNSGYNPQPNSVYMVTYESCQNFETFRVCVNSTISRNCLYTDHEYMVTYLVDNARNLAYSCPPRNVLNPAAIIPGSSTYPRRTDGVNYPYPGGSGQYPQYPPPNSNPFSSRDMPTNQFPSNFPETNRFGGVSDAVNVLTIDACSVRIKPFRDACYDLMNQRQRDARHGRSSNDVQRRICCAAFYFRDCLSRAVLEHCPSQTTTAVEIFMGDIQRQVSTCRDYNREQCSGVSPLQGSFLAMLVTFLMVALLSQ